MSKSVTTQKDFEIVSESANKAYSDVHNGKINDPLNEIYNGCLPKMLRDITHEAYVYQVATTPDLEVCRLAAFSYSEYGELNLERAKKDAPTSIAQQLTEQKDVIRSMVAAIDTIWIEQAFPLSQSSQLVNYDKAKQIIAE